jgi:hypothetical protein
MPVNCPHCSAEVEGWVPADRLKKTAAEKREASAALEAMAAELEAAKANGADVDGLREQLAKAEAALTDTQGKHDRIFAVMAAGVNDQEDVADLLAIYDRRSPDGVSVADWLANADELPRSARALLQTSAQTTTPGVEQTSEAPAAAAPEPAPTPAPAAPMPPPKNGAIATPTSTENYTARSIGDMSLEEYRANRANILAGIGS